jgi:recombinational DNA repair ATPase RecF
MQQSIFHAYVGIARNTYPDKSHQHNDEEMFCYAVDNEADKIVLHELRHRLIAEETCKLIEFKKKQRRSWLERFLFTNSRKHRTLPEGALYEKAIAKIEERLEVLEKCG